MLARTIGSCISRTSPGDGNKDGLEMEIVSPVRKTISYTTVGAEVMRFKLYSRSKRSCTISMCKRPRKPQRKPKPSASELSGS